MSSNKVQKVSVFVSDNFHDQDDDGGYNAGQFDSYGQAVVYCKQIVDDFLEHAFSETRPKTADELYQHFVTYGEDPLITPMPAADSTFSAQDYARERCYVMYSSSGPAK